MPHLIIHTNTDISKDKHATLLADASKLTSEALGKSEQYVMASLYPNESIVFGGSAEPAAYLELKSIGLPESKTQELSSTLCAYCEEHLAIDPGRVYIEFSDAARAMWGWNNQTFG